MDSLTIKKPSYPGDSIKEFFGTIFTWFPSQKQSKKKIRILRQIEDSSVTLIGLGWIGSYTMDSLVQAGIGRIIGIDPNDVKREDADLGNFNREDIGKSRCDALNNKYSQYQISIR